LLDPIQQDDDRRRSERKETARAALLMSTRGSGHQEGHLEHKGENRKKGTGRRHDKPLMRTLTRKTE
jgi:hypothetical protein